MQQSLQIRYQVNDKAGLGRNLISLGIVYNRLDNYKLTRDNLT
ncbi:hypothetical protein [Oscillatoria salina]|nr:hypothetical protein [Oscillatoria salina]